jgi:hypothetical protein
MKKVRELLDSIGLAWKRWWGPGSETRAISSIDPREFSDLLKSGRKQDLKTLAERLSQHACSAGRTIQTKPKGKQVGNSKGPGLAK